MPHPIPIAVHGASGRMGQAIRRVVAESKDLRLVAALVRASPGQPGQSAPKDDGTAADLGYAFLGDDHSVPVVVVDFSAATAFDAVLAHALRHQLAFISGTTGLEASQFAALDRASRSIPVLWSANFSLGVALLGRLIAEAARSLPDWECEIAEMHHRHKQDAPSGTALAFGREVAQARGQAFEAVARLPGRGDSASRTREDIGFVCTRAGDIVGEHTVLFASEGERIELTHRASDRAVFARGAVAAARWIAGQPCGRHALADVLAGTDASKTP